MKYMLMIDVISLLLLFSSTNALIIRSNDTSDASEKGLIIKITSKNNDTEVIIGTSHTGNGSHEIELNPANGTASNTGSNGSSVLVGIGTNKSESFSFSTSSGGNSHSGGGTGLFNNGAGTFSFSSSSSSSGAPTNSSTFSASAAGVPPMLTTYFSQFPSPFNPVFFPMFPLPLPGTSNTDPRMKLVANIEPERSNLSALFTAAATSVLETKNSTIIDVSEFKL